MILVSAGAAKRNHLPQIVLADGGTPMTDIISLRDKAERADRLARSVGDNLTIDRLKTLSAEYRQRADQLSITPETALATEPGSRQSKLIYRTPVRLRRTLGPQAPARWASKCLAAKTRGDAET